MNEQRAIKCLMAHFVHRMNEFFDENELENVEEPELGTRFARWLYAKDVVSLPFKTADGVVAQHFNSEQVQDEQSFVMAHLKMFKDHGIGLLWMADLFVNRVTPLPDELREQIVKTLRFHADRVESREIDERMKEVYKSNTGVA